MGLAVSWLQSCLADFTADDSPMAYKQMRRDYGVIIFLNCAYWNFQNNSQICCCLLLILLYAAFVGFGMSLMFETMIRALDWNISLSLTMLSYFLFSILSISYLVWPVLQRRAVSRMHGLIGQGFHEYEVEHSTLEVETLKTYLRNLKKYIAIFPVVLLSGTACICIFRPQADERYVNGVDLSLPVVSWFPFVLDTWFKYLLGVAVEVGLTGFLVGELSFCFFVYCNLTLNILFQMQRLIDSIKRIDERMAEMMKKFGGCSSVDPPLKEKLLEQMFAKCFTLCIKENSIHHTKILRYLEDFQKILDIPAFLTFLFGAIGTATHLYALNVESALGWKVNAMFVGGTYLLFFYGLCVGGQQVKNLSEGLHEAIYEIKWYSYDQRCMEDIKIFQVATFRPVVLKACGMVNYDLKTFSEMLKSAYSYYNLLSVKRKS